MTDALRELLSPEAEECAAGITRGTIGVWAVFGKSAQTLLMLDALKDGKGFVMRLVARDYEPGGNIAKTNKAWRSVDPTTKGQAIDKARECWAALQIITPGRAWELLRGGLTVEEYGQQLAAMPSLILERVS